VSRGGAGRGEGGGRRPRQVRGWHPTDELAGGHQDAAGLSGRVHTVRACAARGLTRQLRMRARAESEGRFCRRVAGARALPLLRAACRRGGLLRGGRGFPRGCGLRGGAGTFAVFPRMRLRTYALNSDPEPAK
jgi:hypothetical protein